MDQKLESLKAGLSWASGVAVGWRDSNEASSLRTAGKPWGELALIRATPLGQDDRVYLDSGNVSWPLQQHLWGQRVLAFEFKIHNRSFDYGGLALSIMMQAQALIDSDFFVDRYLRPVDLAYATPAAIQELPATFQGRVEDQALLELELNTAIDTTDTALIMSHIEHVAFEMTLKNPGGVDLADPLIIDEVLP